MTTSTSKQPNSISFDSIKVSQPIGDFYIASIDAADLKNIAYSDIRRIEKGERRDVEKYLGIQRELKSSRVTELKKYVKLLDACFPTGIILAVDGKCCSFDKKTNKMTLTEYLDEEDENASIPYIKMAKILDGQHRLAGLEEIPRDKFFMNVSIFVDMDIANQAIVFSTVNLAQTKVTRSLAYDLFGLAEKRSPQRTGHLIAVALDSKATSPLYKRIKRLGVATEGRFEETITQATFIEALLVYYSKDPMNDRNAYLGGGDIRRANADELKKLPFRNMFLDEKEGDIGNVLFNYFTAVKKNWPKAWDDMGTGNMLNKSNGFRGLMRFLRPVYLTLCKPGDVPHVDDFRKILSKIRIKDEEFNVDNFKPGTSGESKLFQTLMEKSGVVVQI